MGGAVAEPQVYGGAGAGAPSRSWKNYTSSGHSGGGLAPSLLQWDLGAPWSRYGVFNHSPFLGRAQGSQGPAPLTPKTTFLTRSRIIPLPWSWGPWKLLPDLPVGLQLGSPAGPPPLHHWALCQVPAGFSRLPPRCSWVWLGEATRATQSSPAGYPPFGNYCVSGGAVRGLDKAPTWAPGGWRGPCRC